jgi:PIN domain nuclease of toxin-antitoxin system
LVSPEKLSSAIKVILGNNSIFVSHINLFEIAIKQKIGKLPELDLSIDDFANRLALDGFNLLALQTHHIQAYSQIPLLPDYHDSFDRLLLATTLSENMGIISADDNFKRYQPQITLCAPLN